MRGILLALPIVLSQPAEAQGDCAAIGGFEVCGIWSERLEPDGDGGLFWDYRSDSGSEAYARVAAIRKSDVYDRMALKFSDPEVTERLSYYNRQLLRERARSLNLGALTPESDVRCREAGPPPVVCENEIAFLKDDGAVFLAQVLSDQGDEMLLFEILGHKPAPLERWDDNAFISLMIATDMANNITRDQ